jgi:hypothetical protein
MIKIKNHITEFLILILVFFLLFYSSNAVLYSDAQRYLDGSFSNAPLYTFIVQIMKSTFKTLNSIVILQTIILGFGIIFFTNTVSKYFHLDILKKLLVSLFLFLPIIEFYNKILTEPICFAFSLFFISFIIKLIYNFNTRNLFWSGIFVILLLMTRKQFFFIYPVILLVYLGLFMINNSKKTFIILVISFMSIFIIHNSLMILNKYLNITTNESKNLIISKRGIFHFVFIDSMYISSSKDAELFKNEKLKKTFTEIFTKINDRKATIKYYDGRGHHGLSFAVIRDIAKNSDSLRSLRDQDNDVYMNIKKDIAIKLISANFIKYVRLIFKKLYDSTWLFVFVPFFILLATTIEFYKNRSNLSLFLISLSSFALANHSVVYLFGRVQPRYLIYSDFILLIFIFIIISNFLQKKTGGS